MARNPLKWPEIEQLGRELYSHLQPALEELENGAESISQKNKALLKHLDEWLQAPCVATVKLDGTNVGIDNRGVVVGRNQVVEPGESYAKVDVWTLFTGYPEKVEQLRLALQEASGGEKIEQVMLYGELLIQSKYNYQEIGLHKKWLCFGAMIRARNIDDTVEKQDAKHQAHHKLCELLRGGGYNARVKEDGVLLVPNTCFAKLLHELQVPTVADGYQPSGVGSVEQWAEHHGYGSIPSFTSTRGFLASPWLQRYLRPEDGIPLGEGLVVASEDGKLFKLKHGGEELGKVPDQLAELVSVLEQLPSSQFAELPEGILEACKGLLLIVNTKPCVKPKVEKVRKVQEEDTEALAAYMSALTKFNDLHSFFQKGAKAKSTMEQELSDQVAHDLVKDYGADVESAKKRSMKIVRQQVGREFGVWKKSQESGA